MTKLEELRLAAADAHTKAHAAWAANVRVSTPARAMIAKYLAEVSEAAERAYSAERARVNGTEEVS